MSRLFYEEDPPDRLFYEDAPFSPITDEVEAEGLSEEPQEESEPRWEIGVDTFDDLEGETYRLWYVANVERPGEITGGFQTELEAAEYLVAQIKKGNKNE